MEVFNEETLDQGLVLFKVVQDGFELFGFERRPGQLCQLTQGDHGVLFNQPSDVLLATFSMVNVSRNRHGAETAAEVLYDVPAAHEGLHKLPELGLGKCVAFFEEVGVRVVRKELDDVPQLFVVRNVSDGQHVLEVLVRGPYLMTSQVGPLMKSICAGHALQVNAIQFTATSQGKVVTDLGHRLHRQHFVFMTGVLVEVVLVEQRSLGNFSGLRVDHGATYHPLTGLLEADAMQGCLRDIVQFGHWLTVEV